MLNFQLKNFIVLFLPIISITSHEIIQPISDVINVLFIKNQIPFDLIMFGGTTYSTNQIVEGIMKMNNERFAVEVSLIKITLNKQQDFKISKSAVVLIPNPADFDYFNRNVILSGSYYNSLRFIIFCEYMSHADYQSIGILQTVTGSKGHVSFYEYILVNSEDGYTLDTYEWFSEEECNKVSIMQENFYNKKLKFWNRPLKIAKKFRNFYGCMLTMKITTLLDPSYEVYYPSMDLFDVMAKKGNFISRFETTHFITVGNQINSTIVSKDGFLSKQVQAKFSVPRLAFKNSILNNHLTTLFKLDRVSFGLSNPESYTSFEKMIFPFDTLTWIFSISVFISAFLVISIMNLLPKHTRQFFYGKNVITPALNVIVIFFGISQTQLPKKSFARMILTTFVLFCLILRTAYQGVLFTLMATDMGKPLPHTLDDLANMNYTVVMMNEEDYLYYMIPTNLR